MRVGVPRERKPEEHRVSLRPSTVQRVAALGHEVRVERSAGEGAGFSDDEYRLAGATLCDDASTVWKSDLVVKVKEPIPGEYGHLRPSLTLFTYLHLAASAELTSALVDAGVRAIAYETVTDGDGGLPLLKPMSAVAGRLSVQMGSRHLERRFGGRGVLLGSVGDVPAGSVVVMGGGTVGKEAVEVAVGLGARVTLFDVQQSVVDRFKAQYGTRVDARLPSRESLVQRCASADLVIGAALVTGARAPQLLNREQVRTMQPGAVLVDVAIDQGGCFETSRPTTHDQPSYVDEGVVHVCVTNLPGAVPRTSTMALGLATEPFVLAMVQQGIEAALAADPHLAAGKNTWDGHITHPAVAKALA